MPCSYYESPEEIRQRQLDEARAIMKTALELDKTTRILCGLMKKLSRTDAIEYATRDAKKWWAEHKEKDKLRMKKIKKKKK